MRLLVVPLMCAALMTSVGAVAHAAEIKLIAANALKESLVELLPAFEKSSGNKVTANWGGTTAIAKRIWGGEAIDVVMIAAPDIDKLIADSKLASGSRVDFAKSGVGIAVRAGLPKPDISSSDAVKRAVLAAKSVAYSSGPSGYYVAELFKKLGIADQIEGKIKQPASGVQISDLLARGEADLGFQQVSELLHRTGIDYVGPLPPDIQNITTYAAGTHPAASEAAAALVKFLTSPSATPVIRKIGMEPARANSR
jgi:molybdate transport system substrate-binding protein